MASTIAPENLPCISSEDNFDNLKLSENDGDLLMSLLEESQSCCDDCDDERLASAIQSLEAEIGVHGHSSSMLPEWIKSLESFEFSDEEEENKQYRSTSCNPDFNWLDMDMDTMPSSPSDGVNNWYVDPFENDMNISSIVEFGDIKAYSQADYGIPLEENSYGSLWLPTTLQ